MNGLDIHVQLLLRPTQTGADRTDLAPRGASVLDGVIRKTFCLLKAHAQFKARLDNAFSANPVISVMRVLTLLRYRQHYNFFLPATASDTTSFVLGAAAITFAFSFLGFFSSRLRLLMPLAMMWLPNSRRCLTELVA